MVALLVGLSSPPCEGFVQSLSGSGWACLSALAALLSLPCPHVTPGIRSQTAGGCRNVAETVWGLCWHNSFLDVSSLDLLLAQGVGR